jgi:hypothetical protein
LMARRDGTWPVTSIIPVGRMQNQSDEGDCDRGTSPNRARRGNHLRLWEAVYGVLFGEWWLPSCSVPQAESSSSQANSPPQMDHIKLGVYRDRNDLWVKSFSLGPDDVRFRARDTRDLQPFRGSRRASAVYSAICVAVV